MTHNYYMDIYKLRLAGSPSLRERRNANFRRWYKKHPEKHAAANARWNKEHASARRTFNARNHHIRKLCLEHVRKNFPDTYRNLWARTKERYPLVAD